VMETAELTFPVASSWRVYLPLMLYER